MLPLANDAYQTLAPYVPGLCPASIMARYRLSHCVKLASNENCFGPSPKASAAALAALSTVHLYPDGGSGRLRGAIAQALGVDACQVIAGNGSNELIELLVRTCVRPGENVVVPTPCFVAYRLAVQAAGHRVREVPLHGWNFDLEALLAACDARTKLLFLANPNNPTGTCVQKEALAAFVRHLPPHVLLVVDEAYIDYVTSAAYGSALPLLADRRRVFIMRTFSKVYGLAGLRVGYGVGAAKLVELLNRGRQPFNVNAVAQAAAVAALDDAAHVRQAVEHNAHEMARLTQLLQARGMTVVPSQANFLLVDVGRPIGPFCEALLQQGVIIRPMDSYGLHTCARITIGTVSQNVALLRAMDVALADARPRSAARGRRV